MPHIRMLYHSRPFQWAVLALLWSLIYLSALSSPALLNDADTVHAEAAREMVASGDWVTLHIKDRKSTRLNSIHSRASRMPSSA